MEQEKVSSQRRDCRPAALSKRSEGPSERGNRRGRERETRRPIFSQTKRRQAKVISPSRRGSGCLFPFFSNSRHRLAIPFSDAQPSTPFGCPAIQGAPRNPVRERSRHGPILYYVWRLSRASACQKFRRVQGETQPREAKRRPRTIGTRAKLPIMALPGCKMGNRHPDSGSAGCRSDPDPLREWGRR